MPDEQLQSREFGVWNKRNLNFGEGVILDDVLDAVYSEAQIVGLWDTSLHPFSTAIVVDGCIHTTICEIQWTMFGKFPS
jgi:hypothetical protein